MSETCPGLEEQLMAFIGRQEIFSVATTARGEDGQVSLSPRGYGASRILGPDRVAFCDLDGSGIETLAHLRENGRITIMFCAFEGAASRLRIYGRGEVIRFDDPRFEVMIAEHFPKWPCARNIILVEVEKVTDRCGRSIPFFDGRGGCSQLERSVGHKPLEEWRARRTANNVLSRDGLPGILPLEAVA
jgi:hypothetical protein